MLLSGGSTSTGVNCTAADDEHHSIFFMYYEKGLGSLGGLALLTGMVAFMIIADRAQFFCEEAVHGDRSLEVFLQRVWVELMVPF